MLTILFKPQGAILKEMGARAKAARLNLGFTQATLSTRSGVPVPTIKRFESTGLLGTAALINIAVALDMVLEFDSLFAAKPYISITQIGKKKRVRGSK